LKVIQNWCTNSIKNGSIYAGKKAVFTFSIQKNKADQNLSLTLQMQWLHSLMDKMRVSGTLDLGSIPSEATKNPLIICFQDS
jgi:hypothetical protein